MFRQGGRFHPYHGISGLAKPFEFDCVLGASYSVSILIFSCPFLLPRKKEVVSFELDGNNLKEDTTALAAVDKRLSSTGETFVR